jgi:hypothetical protein
MAKFGRRYVLQVQGQFLPHSIFYPLTCKFNIERNNFAMANTAEFSLYGLSDSSRQDIYYDTYFKKTLVPIKFFAGYESGPGTDIFPNNFVESVDGSLPLIFNGNVISAYTVREGSELVTHISALDGGFGIDAGEIPSPLNSFPPGWNFSSTMKTLMGYLPGVIPGQILVVPEPAPGSRALMLTGKPWDILQQYTPPDTNLFIDNGVANMIGQNFTLPAKGITEISADTGLLNIPIRNGYLVTVQSLFEPNFVIGQPLTLNSKLSPWVNGLYKIVGLHHNGTISGVESGDARTDLSLLSSRAVFA